MRRTFRCCPQTAISGKPLNGLKYFQEELIPRVAPMAALGGGSTVSRPKSMLYCRGQLALCPPLRLHWLFPSTGQARDPGGKAGLSQGARWLWDQEVFLSADTWACVPALLLGTRHPRTIGCWVGPGLGGNDPSKMSAASKSSHR